MKEVISDGGVLVKGEVAVACEAVGLWAYESWQSTV